MAARHNPDPGCLSVTFRNEGSTIGADQGMTLAPLDRLALDHRTWLELDN